MKFIRRQDQEFEHIVFAELLIPNQPNTYGDYWTPDAIKEAAYIFAKEGYGIDINHDNNDITGKVYVAESFIVRPGDPDFIEGSWVVGMKIEDSEIWQSVLDGDLNGYSYEALVAFLDATLQIEDDMVRTGNTEPDINDGHTHEFMVIVDENNRPMSGGTTDTNGHSHLIKIHSITEEAEGHKHRYNLIQKVSNG